MWERMRREEAGVTLLEIIVSMTILSLIASGVFAAFTFGRQAMVSADLRSQATRLAQETAEELRLAVRSSLTHPRNPQLVLTYGTTNQSDTIPAGNPLGNFGGTRTYTVRTGKINRATGALIWAPGNDENNQAIDDTNYDIKEVTVTVHWTGAQ